MSRMKMGASSFVYVNQNNGRVYRVDKSTGAVESILGRRADGYVIGGNVGDRSEALDAASRPFWRQLDADCATADRF